MTNERYVYYEDLKSRNAEKSGAMHRKNGANSKSCTLPSDSLTDAQKRKLNGECYTYDMQKWYTWQEFKSLPVDIQKEWLQSKMQKYDVGFTTVARYAFDISGAAFSEYLKEKNILLESKKRGRTANRNLTKLREDVERDRKCKQKETKPVAIVKQPSVEAANIEDLPTSRDFISNLSLTMNGFDTALFQGISGLFKGCEVKISIDVEVLQRRCK